jgi:lipid-binding SYLF domain-containing protein
MAYFKSNNRVIAGIFFTLMLVFSQSMALADTARELDQEADLALEKLYRVSPVAKTLSSQASGVLVFPSIVKAGLGIGGQYGKGVLREKGKTTGYYESSAVSYGLQAGAQTFGYALFLMSPEAMEYLESSEGWEVGVGPSIVVVDDGMAKTMTTTTEREGIYAFIFGQKGLMAGLGLHGSKITKIEP